MVNRTSGAEEGKGRKPIGFLLLLLLATAAAMAAGWVAGIPYGNSEQPAESRAASGKRAELALGEIIFPIRRSGSIRYLVMDIQLAMEGVAVGEPAERLVAPLREIALETMAEVTARTSLDRLESRSEAFEDALMRDMNHALSESRVKELTFTSFDLRDLQE